MLLKSCAVLTVCTSATALVAISMVSMSGSSASRYRVALSITWISWGVNTPLDISPKTIQQRLESEDFPSVPCLSASRCGVVDHRYSALG